MEQPNTPALLLDSMYNGRGGGVNLWPNQGLDLEIEDKECKPYPELPQVSLPSPPYTRDTILSLDLDKHSGPLEYLVDVEVPLSDVSVASLSMRKESDSEGVPGTPFWARMRRIMDYRSLSVEHSGRPTFKRAASVSSLPDSNLRVNRCGHAAVPYWDPCSVKPLLLSSMGLTGRQMVTQDEKTGQSVSPSLAPVVGEVSGPACVALEIANITMHQEAGSFTARVEEIATWLFGAWSVLLSAHHDLRNQLLAVDTALEELFAQTRVECTTRLAFAAAWALQSEVTATCTTDVTDAEKQVRELVSWTHNVKPDADFLLLHEVVALAATAIEVVDSAPDLKAEKMNDFLMCKSSLEDLHSSRPEPLVAVPS